MRNHCLIKLWSRVNRVKKCIRNHSCCQLPWCCVECRFLKTEILLLWSSYHHHHHCCRNITLQGLIHCLHVVVWLCYPQIIPAIGWLLAWCDSDLVTYQRWPVPLIKTTGTWKCLLCGCPVECWAACHCCLATVQRASGKMIWTDTHKSTCKHTFKHFHI